MQKRSPSSLEDAPCFMCRVERFLSMYASLRTPWSSRNGPSRRTLHTLSGVGNIRSVDLVRTPNNLSSVGNDRFHRTGKQAALEWNEETVAQDDDEESSDPASAPSKFEPRYSQSTVSTVNLLDDRNIPYDLIMMLLEQICFQDQQYLPYSAAILVFMPGLNEIRRLHDMFTEHDVFGNVEYFRVYPLHSTISSENQGAVFDIPPPGVRKIVIGMNLARLSITNCYSSIPYSHEYCRDGCVNVL